MLFNSLDFALFLPLVFILYWFIFNKSLKIQNLLIVIVSYIFYGWWDWKFLSLILFSTIVDFTIGRLLFQEKRPSYRKIFLWISIIVNLGFLCYFKYFNFFIENFVNAFAFFGKEISIRTLNIVLPVGISFYTFQTLSYTIDVYRKKLEPTKNFIAFAAFVSFFPQLVAGPIERATHLLPQFYKKREFNYDLAKDGIKQMLWGLFKKVVIADNCAQYADMIFNNHNDYSGSTLLLGAVFFTFQIYGDFSGYSDIAIGLSRLFGFDLMKNFAFPYFSRDIAEFWRRWHISLSTWFRDYLYIPLGGSKGGVYMRIRNTFIIFLVSGFWHGANWTFIFWGALNALYFLPLLLTNNNRKNIGTVAEGKLFPSINEFTSIVLTFILTIIAWIFFRARDLSHAFSYLRQMFTDLFSMPQLIEDSLLTIYLIIVFLLIEWIHRTKDYGLQLNDNIPIHFRWSVYLIILFLSVIFMGGENSFIYFQF